MSCTAGGAGDYEQKGNINMENIILKPIFSANDIKDDLIFINCTLGFNGNINLLFAEKRYDYIISRQIENVYPVGKRLEKPTYRTVRNFTIFPKTLQDYILYIPEENKVIEVKNKNINYTHGLQIDTDKFCFICHSKRDSFRNSINKNCEIYDSNGKLLNMLNIGTGINDVQTNSKKELWVSYSDIGIYQGDNLEKKGLNCFNVNGKVLYKYDSRPFMDSCDSLNVYSDNEILVNIYAGSVELWHAFAKINNKKVEKTLEWRCGTKFIAASDNKLFIEEGDWNDGIHFRHFILVNIENYNGEGIDYDFFNENNERLHCVHAQRDTLYFWTNNCLYKFSIKQI
jgi:hypothetical protein